MKMRKCVDTGSLLLASCVIAMASAPAWATATTVYKCFDKNLGVLYTDEPCRGEHMNIRAGDADPIAVAELQREREALSRSSAQRIADYRRAALDREYAAAQRAYGPPEGVPAYSGADGYYPAGYGVVPYSTAHRDRAPKHDARRFDHKRFVPNPPRGLPRR
jgi:hypothetical protein